MGQTKTSSLEIITYLFISKAFTIVKFQHSKITDEIDFLPYVCDLLLLANNQYKRSLSVGRTELDAIHDVYKLFRKIEAEL